MAYEILDETMEDLEHYTATQFDLLPEWWMHKLETFRALTEANHSWEALVRSSGQKQDDRVTHQVCECGECGTCKARVSAARVRFLERIHRDNYEVMLSHERAAKTLGSRPVGEWSLRGYTSR